MPRTSLAAVAAAVASLAALVGAGIGIPTVVGASDDGVASRPAPVAHQSNIDPVTGLDLTNLHLVENLSPIDRCLFDVGVFPRGGVGDPNGLPGAGAPEPMRSFMVLRDEVLRTMNQAVAGVTWDGDTGTPTTVTIAVKADSSFAHRTDPDGYVAQSPHARDALASLRLQGFRIDVVPDAVGSMADMCEVHAYLDSDEFRAGLDAVLAQPGVLPSGDMGMMALFMMGPDQRTGVYTINPIPQLVTPLRELTARFGDVVLVDELSF